MKNALVIVAVIAFAEISGREARTIVAENHNSFDSSITQDNIQNNLPGQGHNTARNVNSRGSRVNQRNLQNNQDWSAPFSPYYSPPSPPQYPQYPQYPQNPYVYQPQYASPFQHENPPPFSVQYPTPCPPNWGYPSQYQPYGDDDGDY